MSQVDNVCAEKTYLSHMYNTSAFDKHTLSSKIHIKSVILIVAIF